MLRSFLIICTIISLSACGSAYQKIPHDGGLGYDDTQLDKNLWSVSYSGMGVVSYSKSKDLWFLRAATLVDEAGIHTLL